ncbi:CBO0543 family protein [Rossellomorea vietnamensis]|uniref:CBO0543 family protein n=1 Tax=Rossellomorea vietnamensis TaxID=218284 RepID=UPI003CF4EAE7
MILMCCTIIVALILSWRIPKKLSRLEMYACSIFSIYLALAADSILGGMYHLYAYFKPGVELIDYAAIGIYPAISILFLNLFPFTRPFLWKCSYIMGWTVFSLFYEWSAANFSSLFLYTGWKIGFSVPIYPLLFVIQLLNFKLVKKLISHR